MEARAADSKHENAAALSINFLTCKEFFAEVIIRLVYLVTVPN